MDTGSYVILDKVYDQVGALSQVTTAFDGVQVYCSLGAVVIIINGVSFNLAVGETFDESVVGGQTFQVTGTGTWKGFLRGTK